MLFWNTYYVECKSNMLICLGVPEGPCGIPELKKFQAVLPEYQIKVYSATTNVEMLYTGPEALYTIFLIHDAEEAHYNVITGKLFDFQHSKQFYPIFGSLFQSRKTHILLDFQHSKQLYHIFVYPIFDNLFQSRKTHILFDFQHSKQFYTIFDSLFPKAGTCITNLCSVFRSSCFLWGKLLL